MVPASDTSFAPLQAPPKDIKLRDVFKGKLGVLLGVPGAFTPGCSKSHVPSFISEFDALKKAGVEARWIALLRCAHLADCRSRAGDRLHGDQRRVRDVRVGQGGWRRSEAASQVHNLTRI